ncbi:energy transducer TonB [Aggregatimonas sangjinii]|nr:energy transducer TonB [Aggregatimonas sangjinii]
MRQLFILLTMCSLASCGFFTSKEEKTAELVNEQLQQIDWSDVDNYPLFENCDETVSKLSQRRCFEKELLKHCSKTLMEYDYHLNTETNPKVLVDILVDQDGRISVLAIQKDSVIDVQIPEFDKNVTQAIKNIPPLAPALKRGIPVKAKFRIPIVLKSG